MDLTVGQKACRSLTLTSEHVKAYAEITGDYNPLHFDRDFAAKTKFKDLVVQGGLTTGVLNALVATDMPGPGTVFLSHDWKFTAPVYIGDTITGEAEVLQAWERVLGENRRLQTQLYNGYGEHVAHLYTGLEDQKLFM